MGTSRRVFTLTEMLVVVLCIGVLCALLFPAIYKAKRRAKVAACSGNLSQMWKMMNIYRSSGGRRRSMPLVTGTAFWRSLENTVPPLVDTTSLEVFLCPVKGNGIIGDCEYWGPGRSVNLMVPLDPVGGDAMGERPNHGKDGCNLVRKSSDVITISAAEWANLDQAIGEGNVMTRPIP